MQFCLAFTGPGLQMWSLRLLEVSPVLRGLKKAEPYWKAVLC